MDMQHMAMDNTHNTFWREDQVCILFLTNISLLNEARVLNYQPLQRLMFGQPISITNFLMNQVPGKPEGTPVPARLHFLNDDFDSQSMSHAPKQRTSDMRNLENSPGIFPGVYPFEVNLSQTDPRVPFVVSTSVASFFQIEDLSQPGSSTTAMPMRASASEGGNATDSLVVRVVNKINTYLEELNQHLSQENGRIFAAVAAPVWLSGGTGGGAGQGCPLTPPIPVKGTCSNWHIEMPDLSSDLQSKTGDGVTIFILDSFPERGIIARAARFAGDDNLLLKKVNETVKFDYSVMSGVQDVQAIGDTKGTFVGKDVYGRHYPIRLEDHGLFIAGIVCDLAPKAHIECIRVLDDLCIGDVQFISNALWNIYLRKVSPDTLPQAAPLVDRSVVINMSLVIPTDEELKSKNVDPRSGAFGDIRANFFYLIKALTDLGVIIVASAGNEADLRETPTGKRPDALRPAAWGNPPYNIENIIPVGAVDGKGQATSYSCYPGPRGIAVYGGEVPSVTPKDPPSSNPVVAVSDAVRGIYSSVEYPPLSADPPDQYYVAPNDHAWAYWVGTSFATPIISALVARILEVKKTGAMMGTVRDNVLRAASLGTTWDRLSSGSAVEEDGRVIRAVQQCRTVDRDDEDEARVEIEITEINMIVEE